MLEDAVMEEQVSVHTIDHLPGKNGERNVEKAARGNCFFLSNAAKV